jgi:hypothetical protein
MSAKKQKYDMNSPEARALIDEIVHGTFMKEGTMVAFPTCFPGASVPITADEGHITALDITGDGIVYGGTSGRAAHLFVAMFHGVTGVVFDLGTIEGADQCVAIGCGGSQFAACVNGPGGGRVITGGLQGLPFDLIQEWGFSRPPLKDLGKVNDEPIVHAVFHPPSARLVGTTTNHIFTCDLESGTIRIAGEISGTGRIALGSKESVVGRDGAGHLWRYRPETGRLERRAIPLPEGSWEHVPLHWARDRQSGRLYTADGEGALFSFDEDLGFSAALGRTQLAPVGPMAVTFDGRVFGFCGDEMAKMFCYEPATGEVRNLGVAVSVLERRRYGYVFGDAVTGRDGQILFGENDDLGHLWLYFPRIQPGGGADASARERA